MKKLIATQSMTYATRRLMPGDPFRASDRDADLLIRIKRAKPARVPGTLPQPPASLKGKIDPADDLKALREKYQEVVGKRPFGGWKADELQRRIDEACAS